MITKATKMIGYGIKTRVSKKLKPRWCVFTCVEICNSRCKHCNIWQTPADPERLTYPEILKTFQHPYLSDLEYVIITGGEPTLRDDIVEVFKIIHACCPKATLQLSTNGLASDKIKRIVKEILDEGIRLDVGLSLDGVGNKHDDMRGVPGNFKKIDGLIDYFKTLKEEYSKFNFSLSTTVSELTVDNYDEIKEYAMKKDVDIEYSAYQSAPFYKHSESDKDMSRDNKMKRIVEDMPPSPRKGAWLDHLNGKSIRFPCFALRNFFVLLHNGDVVPCLLYSDKVAGNVKKNTVEEIFDNNNIRKDIVEPCPGCLNSWGYSWSAASRATPYIKYFMRHPLQLRRVK